MKRATYTTLVILMMTGSTSADECRDKVVDLVLSSQDVRPSRGELTSEIKGGMTSTNEFLIAGANHYLYKPIEPANMPWVLTWKDGMYQSSDEGESWTKVHSFDAEENRQAGLEVVRKQAESVTNAVCTEEEFEGQMHDVLEADMTYPPPNAFDIHSKYWVNRETGDVRRAETLMKSDNFENFTTQMWEFVDELDLPTPD